MARRDLRTKFDSSISHTRSRRRFTRAKTGPVSGRRPATICRTQHCLENLSNVGDGVREWVVQPRATASSRHVWLPTEFERVFCGCSRLRGGGGPARRFRF